MRRQPVGGRTRKRRSTGGRLQEMSGRQPGEADDDLGKDDAYAELDTDTLEAEAHRDLEFDAEAWTGFTRIFQQVQLILDQNRLLIGRINHNHQSGISERIASNVGLINDLNRNLGKVHKLYAGAAINFSKSFREVPKQPGGAEESLKTGADKVDCTGVTSTSITGVTDAVVGHLEPPQRLVPSASAEV